jgi:hypothetical protein
MATAGVDTMSVVLEVTVEGETFDVEVFHDGHIEFPDRNLRHEQAMAEFTDSESAVVGIYDLWSKDPIAVLCYCLELPKDSHTILAADYAEHVLRIYEAHCPNDPRPKLAIDATRDFVAGKIGITKLKMAAKATRAAAKEAFARFLFAAGRAAQSANEATFSAQDSTRPEVGAAWAALYAAQGAAKWAAASSVSVDSLEWEQAPGAEFAWQVRRFVDCMEAIGQGLDWPDMKATP